MSSLKYLYYKLICTAVWITWSKEILDIFDSTNYQSRVNTGIHTNKIETIIQAWFVFTNF